METNAFNAQQQQQPAFIPKISGGRKGGFFIAPKLGDAAIKDLIARQGPSPFLNVDPNARARIGKILHAENVDEYQMEAFWRGIEASRETFVDGLLKNVSGMTRQKQQMGPEAMDEGQDDEGASQTPEAPAFASDLSRQMAERGEWTAPKVDPTRNLKGEHVPLPPKPVNTASETAEQTAKRLFAAPQKKKQQQKPKDAMDVDDDDDDEDNVVSRTAKTDVRPASGPLLAVFKRIDDLVANISPLGYVTDNGTKFQLIAPPQEVDDRLAQKLPDMSLLMKAAERTYSNEVDMIIIHSHISACPVHVSPLLLYCNRQVDPCMRFTDAITLASRLHYLRKAIHELDTKDKPFKKQCDTNRIKLEFRIAGDLWEAVDSIIDLGRVPMGERKGPYANDNRAYFVDLVHRFANEWVRYSRRYIAVQEFCILSMCRIPYAYFAPLMTPKLTPPASAAFSDPMDPGFAVLRANMCGVLRARNKYFCGKYSAAVDPDTGKYIYLGIDPKAWMAMRLNDGTEGEEGGIVRIEDRLIKLGKYESTPIPPEFHGRCMFGIYQDWIDLHTLREVLMFMSNDDRRKKINDPANSNALGKESVSDKNNRGRMRPVLTEAEEEAAERAAKAVAQERNPDRRLADMALPEEGGLGL